MEERITFLVSKEEKKKLKMILLDRDESLTEFFRRTIEKEIKGVEDIKK